LAVAQLDGGDEARFGMLFHLGDHAFHALYAALRGVLAQIGRVQPGVEMVAVGIGRPGARHQLERRRKALPARHHRRDQPFLERRHVLEFARQPHPVQIGRTALDRRTVVAEAVEEALANLAPVLELDAKLEGRLRLEDEVRLVDAERAVEIRQRRQCRFAHAHRADFRRLHQRDPARCSQHTRQSRSAHPAGGAAADDDNFTNRLLVHLSYSLLNQSRHRSGRRSSCSLANKEKASRGRAGPQEADATST
jgi:hypothetical protein